MSFVRPEVAQALRRWREVIAGAVGAGAGLWLMGLGGPAMLILGGIVTASALALTLLAWRRMRFRFDVDAPGVVEIDEGRISYLGPVMGGSLDLSELTEIQVLDVAGRRRCWRMRQSDGQVLLVPLAAAGAEALYDHLASLPGMQTSALMSALEGEAATPRTLWRRASPATPALPR